jgi:hypothetical protein
VLSNEVEEEFHQEQQRHRQRFMRVAAAALCLPSGTPVTPSSGSSSGGGGGGGGGAAAAPQAALQRRLLEPLAADEVARVLEGWCAGRGRDEAQGAAAAVQRWAASHCPGGRWCGAPRGVTGHEPEQA